MKNPYATPKFISDSQQRLGQTYPDKRLFATNLFAWDAFKVNDDGTTTGYDSADNFVNAVIGAGTGVTGDVLFNISLRPSTTLPSAILKARRNTGEENYQQQEDDFAKLFYSKEIYEFIIDTELDFNNKLIFFTFKSIYNLRDIDKFGEEIKDTDFYITDSYKTITKADGAFDYAIIRIKKLNPITKRGAILSQSSGTFINIYTKFAFFRINIQPKNVRRVRRTFYGKPVLYSYFVYGENQVVPEQYTITDGSDQWYEGIFPFRITGQAISVWPLYSQEWKYWSDAIGAGDSKNSRKININKVQGNLVTHGNQIFQTGVNGDLEIPGNQGDGFERTAPILDKGDSNNVLSGLYNYAFEQLSAEVEAGNFNINDLIETSTETVDFMLPNGYDLFGLTRRTSPDDTSVNAIPRKQSTNGYWENLKDELIYFFDFMTDESVAALITKQFGTFYPVGLERNEKQQQYANDSIADYTPYFSSETKFGSIKRKQNLSNLLQRTLNWINTAWTNPPEGIVIENSINPNTPTWEYDPDKLNSHIGLWPFDIETTWDMCIGTGFERQIGTSSIKSFKYLIFGTSSYNYRYLLGQQYKLTYLPYDIFYTPDSGNRKYVLEIEFAANLSVITREEMYVLGGDKMDIEYFENTYEDSLINGDIPCKIDIDLNNDGESKISIELPPQTYPAPNNQGNPRQVYQAITYGVTG